MVGLPDGEKSLRICLLISTEYTNVTDRWTDIARQHSLRLCTASNGKNVQIILRDCVYNSTITKAHLELSGRHAAVDKA